MFYFILAIAIFLIFLIWICISLCMILKMRNNVEECEYILKKACERQYDFILVLDLDCMDDILMLREKAKKESELENIIKYAYRISVALDTIALQENEKEEKKSLKMQIDKYINLYNNAVDTFNSAVFFPLNRPVARMCGIKRIDRLV